MFVAAEKRSLSLFAVLATLAACAAPDAPGASEMGSEGIDAPGTGADSPSMPPDGGTGDTGGTGGMETSGGADDAADSEPDDDDTGAPKFDVGSPTVEPSDDSTGGCGEVDVAIDQTIPTLVLLVDQSGSMTSNFQGVSRWNAVYDTLMEPTSGVVARLQDDVRFGLALYTSHDGDAGGECPLLTTVDPMIGNFDGIEAVYQSEVPQDETPTGESLAAIAEDLAALDVDGPKAIVLATDGEPDTCAEPNPQNGQPEALAAAQAAWDQDIRTYVISVGNDVGEEHLQAMANVGAGKDAEDPDPEPYYQALSPDQLVSAFDSIVAGFVSCSFAVDGIVDLEKACEGTVILDGVELECGTDWDVPDPGTLELLGEACEVLKDGDEHDVSASWPCGVVAPPG